MQLIQRGALSAWEVGRSGSVAAIVPENILGSFQAIPWADSIEFGLDDYRPSVQTLPWGVDSIDAERVHVELANRGNGIKIGVIDDGIDCSHRDLTGRVAGGFDFRTDQAVFCHGQAADHGTSVAGVLAASDNDVDVVGVAPLADLYALRVCGINSQTLEEECTDLHIAAALDWARTNGLAAVNISLSNCGGEPPQFLKDAISNAYSAGVVIVASAGNGENHNPPCPPNSTVSGIARQAGVIAVSALNQDGSFVAEHQHGPAVDLAAPHCVPSLAVGAGIDTFCGASYAVPHVTGTVALLIREGFTGPNLIAQRLTEPALDRGSPGKDDFFGYGSLRA